MFVTERVEGGSQLGLYYNGNEDYFDDAGGQCGPTLAKDDDCVVTDAVADSSQKIRIIFDELLDGSSVEEFLCACAGAAGTGNCPNNVISSIDPAMCANNPDTAADEGSRWLDDNADGMPDKARLVSGVVTVTCDGVATPFSSGPTDGFYNPSGNQLIPVATGLAGLGPALVVTVSSGLRTNADCTVAVGSMVLDKEGNTVPALPGTAKFHTEKLAVIGQSPDANATGVPLNATVTVTFNAVLDAASITGVILREKTAGTAVTSAVTLSEDGTEINIAPGAALTANTDYEVVIPVTVTDAFGGAFPAEQILAFKTGT